LKDGKEVNAVTLAGRLFHARATVTRNDRSPMVLSRVRRTIIVFYVLMYWSIQLHSCKSV